MINRELRVIRHFSPKLFLSLGNVASLMGVKIHHHNDFVVWVPDVISEFRPLLWELKDYRVSSVTGGAIWLIKR